MTRRPKPSRPHRTRRWLLPLVVTVVVTPALAREPVGASSASSPNADPAARAFLNELSARRRVTTLFENRQSAFHGVQENFVNTSAGNLTFLVRDLVRVGGMPIVMGRVYDSALHGGDAARDFGPGWKLAVRESLSERGGRLVYRDASNAEHLLEVRGGDIVPAVPALAPVSSGRLHRTPAASIVELRAGDIVRHFVKRHPPRPPGASARPDRPWRLTRVHHPRGWLRFDWEASSRGSSRTRVRWNSSGAPTVGSSPPATTSAARWGTTTTTGACSRRPPTSPAGRGRTATTKTAD